MEIISSFISRIIPGTNDGYATTQKQIEALMMDTEKFVDEIKQKKTKQEDRIVMVKQIDTNIKVVENMLVTLSSQTTDNVQTKRNFLAKTRSRIFVINGVVHPPQARKPSFSSETNVKSLFGPASNNDNKRRNFIADREVPTSSDDDGYSLLLDEQKRAMAEQDELLASLLPSLGALKNISLALNTEINLQNRMLTEMDAKVDQTNLKLVHTTKRTDNLRKQL